MCVGQRSLRRPGPSAGERDVRSVVRPVEKPLDDKLFEKRQARRAVKLPESTRLRERQAQTGHFVVLTTNASQETIVCLHGSLVRIIRRQGPISEGNYSFSLLISLLMPREFSHLMPRSLEVARASIELGIFP